MRKFLLSLAAFAVFSQLLGAGAWRWSDPETGETVYGELPPRGVPAEAVRVKTEGDPPGNADGDALNPAERIKARVEDLRSQRQEREKQKEEAEDKKAIEEKLAQACHGASANLDVLNSRGRASLLEGDEYRALTEEERQDFIAKNHAFLDEHCKR